MLALPPPSSEPPTDSELLARYLLHHDQPAFTSLVKKYAPLIHAAALRQINNDAIAQEITQAVFLLLAQKGTSLIKQKRPTLAPWLLKATRFAAIDSLRHESARKNREHIAIRTRTTRTQSKNLAANAQLWSEISPLLDEALAALSPTAT